MKNGAQLPGLGAVTTTGSTIGWSLFAHWWQKLVLQEESRLHEPEDRLPTLHYPL